MLKKRLILIDDNKPKKKTQRVESKSKEPKLAAYNIDWFDSTSTQNKCLKHTSSTNLPSTQEEQLTFLLSKYQAFDIKTAFADAIGKVGTGKEDSKEEEAVEEKKGVVTEDKDLGIDNYEVEEEKDEDEEEEEEDDEEEEEEKKVGERKKKKETQKRKKRKRWRKR
jgi:hypothetical protein